MPNDSLKYRFWYLCFRYLIFLHFFPWRNENDLEEGGKVKLKLDAQKAVIKTSARRFKHLPSFVCCNNKKKLLKTKNGRFQLVPLRHNVFPSHPHVHTVLPHFLPKRFHRLNFYNVYLKRFLMKNSRFVLKKEKN